MAGRNRVKQSLRFASGGEGSHGITVVIAARYENTFDFADVPDIGEGIGCQEDQICVFAPRNRAEICEAVQEFGRPDRGHCQRFPRGQTSLNEQFQFIEQAGPGKTIRHRRVGPCHHLDPRLMQGTNQP